MSRSVLRAAVLVLVLGLPSLAWAAAPTTTTTAANGITTSSAVLNGAGDPNSEPTVGWFRYSANNPVTCNDSFGTRVPAASGTDLGTGTIAVPYSITTTGLTQGVTYYFCSLVSNASGTAFGTVLSFTIPGIPVTLTTGATGVTSSNATLRGSANPVAAATLGWFRYDTVNPGTCNDSFGVRAPSSSGTNLGMGTSSVDYSSTTGTLLPGTTYYYCAIAENLHGETYGGILFFTTPATAPTVTTQAATSVTTTSATINATGIARGDTTIGWFRYSTINPGTCNDTFGTRLPAAGGTSLGAANASVAFSESVTGVPLATTIYYCAIAANGIGTTVGGVTSFTTLATAPSVTTTGTTLLTGTTVRLVGSGTPNGASTAGYFRYGTTNPGTCSDSFGTRAPTSSSSDSLLGSGLSPVTFNRDVGGLSPTTTYFFCAIAYNGVGVGTVFGAVLSFTTPALVPTVTTLATTVASGTTATLNGSANPNGDAATGWFRYSTTNPVTCNDSFGVRAPATGGASLGGGLTVVPFSQAVSGLTPLTTYFVCALASNGLGTSVGAVGTFTTPAPPSVNTNALATLDNTSATLTGSAVPNRAATTGYFRYSSTNPGTCNDTFGSRAPTTGGTNLGAGTSAVPFSQLVSSLSPGITYYYCAIASNSEGTGFGSVLSFTTLAAPTMVTGAATLVTSSSVTLNATGNPNGATATGWFRYATTNPGACTDGFGVRLPGSGGSSLGSGVAALGYSQATTSLTPGTTYFYCAIGNNTHGTSLGAIQSFTTPIAAPVVVTSPATMLTGTTAQLNGTANPGADATTGWFRYSTVSPGTCNDSFGTRAPAAGGASLGAGTAVVPYAQGITGLSPSVTYFVCAIASNAVGTSTGALVTFTTPAQPTVITVAASGLTNAAAQLNGTANPNRAATTGWFRYSSTDPGTCNDTFGSRAPTSGGTNNGSGSTPQAYGQSVSGLSPGQLYYYCAIASNSEGLSFGAVMSFTTQDAPTMVTTTPTLLTSTSATLNGTGNPNGALTSAWFRYATASPGTCNDTFGIRVPPLATTPPSLGSGSVAVPYGLAISGLTPATTYYYCAIGSNPHATRFGAVVSFTTPAIAPSVSTGTPTLTTGTASTLNGTANPNGDATTAWFRYSTVSPGTCNDSFGIRAPAAGGSTVGSGLVGVPYAQGIIGLAPATTYHVCAIASNGFGLTFGAVVTFTTPTAPTVTTSALLALDDDTATLAGSANPNRATTTGWFRYSTTNPGTCSDGFGSRAPASGGTNLGNGSSAQTYSQGIAGLSTGTIYYYCAIAMNGEGMAFGAVLSFTTHAIPTVTTNAATLLTSTSATINGAAIPNGATSTGFFRYATTHPGTCNDSFGIRAPSPSGGTGLGAGSVAITYAQSIGGLTPATTYFFCAIASNTYGTGFGAVLQLTTPAIAPTMTTTAATLTTGTTSQLNGTANPNGDTTTAWFRYSTVSPGTCNDSFGTRAPAAGGSAVGNGVAAIAYAQTIGGLSQATTYFVCAIGANALGTSFGSLMTFTTAAPPTVVTTSITPFTASTATINGSGNPNRSPTTGWYRYSTTNPGTCNDTFGTRAPASGGTNLGSGSSAQNYSLEITGLAPATLYYVCAIAQNGEGTGFGAVLSFTTLATPTVVTVSATLVTSTSATLSGTGVPNGAPATGFFRYSTTNPGTCNSSFGTRIPSTGGTSLGAGSTAMPFSQAIAGLTPGATYYYCAIANNTVGDGFGALLQFTATAGLPSVSTVLQSGVTTTTATLNGSANPNGASTTGWFRISTTNPVTCNDSFGTRVPGVAGSALGAGNGVVAYSEALTTLAPGTTYHYCAIANNAAGTGFGAVRTFATPAPPTVATLAATPVTATTGTLNAAANPNGFATTGWFRYTTTDPGTCTDTFGIRAPITGGAGLGTAVTPVSYSQALTGLAPATTYYFCAIAQSSIGTSLGEVLSFTTPPTQPSVTTLVATGIVGDGAVLEATANPNGAASTGWFRYATTNPGTCGDGFGTRAPASGGTNLGGGNTSLAYSNPITGLTAGTTYFYCAIASNGIGTSFGTILSFTTAAAPTVTTATATGVSSAVATLQGSANPNQSATTGHFRYATTNPGTCDDSFGIRAPASGGTALGAGASPISFNQPLTGLTTNVTYFYCAIASNPVGTRFGAVMQFTTSAVPAVATDAPTLVTNTTATLNGNANPNLMTATGWFRYSTVNPGTCNDSFGTRAPTSGGTALGAGSAPVAYNRPITGLLASTTYYYCALASNPLGTGFGALQSFTTAGPPTVTTDPATLVATTTATLNGQANPNQGTTTGYFRYSTTSPGTCNDTFGTRAPSSGGAALGNGATAVAYAQAVTGLNPGATYFFCAIASNSFATRFGAVMSFTTQQGPTVVTAAATAVTSTTATLNGSANPNGTAATGWYRYATTNPGTCDDSFGTRAPTSGGAALGTGSSAVAYPQPVTGLTPSTQYFFCAIASNSIGTSVGAVLSFTTPGAPIVTTTAATAIASASATLNGSANPSLSATTGYFRYATTNPGTCDDSFGTRAPSTGGASLGAGSSAVTYSQPASTLTAGTTYFFCAIAANANGVSFGAVLSFTTAQAPIVTTDAPTLVLSTSATLNGTANPNLSTATGYFRFSTTNPVTCNDTFGTRAPTTGGTALGAGATPVAYNRPITGLVAATTYYYCAIASSSIGLGLGTVVSFTTPAAPTVTTNAATAVASTGATLNGSANPNFGDATGYFRYATTSPGSCNDTFGTRAPSSGGTALGAGAAAVPYAQPITGLTTGTTYFFCAIATNPVGTRFGMLLSFTTTAAPIVTTTAATAVTSTSATLNGSANPNLTAATGYFRYSTTSPGTCNDSFGTRAPISGGAALGAGSTPIAYAEGVTGLTPGTQYFFCAIATNTNGTSVGAVLSLTTPAAPSVTSLTATAVTSVGATLNGSANPNLAVTTGWFRYSATNPGTCDDSFGTRAPTSGGASLGAGSVAVTYAQAVVGLTAGTTYYYCAIASNAIGTRFGSVLTLVTAAAPTVTTEPATVVTATAATLNGSANPNQAATTGWFRYSATNPGSCNDTFGTRAPTTGGTALGAGTSVAPYPQPIAGLTPATTYYYCAIASNAIGTSFGAIVTLSTLTGPPTVVTTAPTDVVGDAAVLNGSANPNGAATTGHFRYGTIDPGTCNDSFGTRAPTTGGTALGAGTTAVVYAETVTGLTDGLTYYYCALATNTAGTSVGAVLSFVAGGVPPTVTTEAATTIEAESARIAGTANPNGTDATGWFRYGEDDPGTCDDSFGTRAPATGLALGAGTSAAPYSTLVTGLQPNFTYYYCAAASNQGGAVFGAVRSFTTDSVPPVVRTVDTVDDGAGTITVSGAANPRGTATTVWFRYDLTSPGTCNDTFGTRLPTSDFISIGAGRVEAPFSQAVTDLADGTYFVCAIGSNAAGLGFGEVLTFEVGGAVEPTDPGGCCHLGSRPGATAPPLGTMITLGAALLLLFRRRRRA